MVLARQILKADLRQTITAWKALVWAYADEHVLVATNSEGRLANTGYTSVNFGESSGSGAINGFLEAHDDAVAIDSMVRAWFDFDRNQYFALGKVLERRLRPPKGSELPPLRMVPKLKINGMPEMVYKGTGRHDMPLWCWVVREGYDSDEVAKAQELYDVFVALLDIMPGLKLSKWRIAGQGLDTSGRIIDKALKPVTG